MNPTNDAQWTFPLAGLVIMLLGVLTGVTVYLLVRRRSRAVTRNQSPPTVSVQPVTEAKSAMSLPSEQRCPCCGGALAPGVAQGLCPKCVLAAGFETQAATKPVENSVQAGDAVPAITELNRHFPQLEIVAFLGRGGMGWVFKARQKNLDRLIALKVLPPGVAKDPAFAERFHREARALARLNHPNIVGIHDFGQAGPYYFFVMEFVDGLNLRQLERSRRLSPEEAFALVPSICEALQFAHDEGIVHRDIKPENILVDQKGRVKIADFGIAKIVGRQEDITLTGTQHLLGTPHYMAPEQVATPNKVDHRADIFALGVVFYEMLTGELPLGRFELPSKKLHVDVRVDEVVLKSLERDPERRYQTVAAVKTDVESLSPGSSPCSRPGRSGDQPASRASGETAAATRAAAVAPDPSQHRIFGVINAAWRNCWMERAKWFAITVQTVLVIGHFACLLAFFSTSIKSVWESENRRQFAYTVGAVDPWFQIETYPEPHTPFHSGVNFLSSSMLFLVTGFALYYAFWRIEKARKPKVGWWSSPAPLAIGWVLWAAVAVGMGTKYGHDALRESQLGGGLLAPQLRSALEIRSLEERDEALRKVALRSAEVGDVATLKHALGEMRGNAMRDDVTAQSAQALARLPAFATNAVEIARLIRGQELRDATLAELANPR